MKRLIYWTFRGLIIFISISAQAQSLTGIWRGTFYSPADIAMGGSKYRYEVQINNNGRETKGVTYSYQNTRFYGKASLVGVWSPSTKNLVLQEDKMLELKIAGGGDGCLMTCYLTYKKENGKEYLEGTYSSSNMNNPNQNCGGGRVFLEKVPDTDFELEPFLENKKTPETTSKAKIKPGQEDFLVNKPPTTASAKPPVNKPPVTQTQPAPNTGSNNTTAAKPPVTTKPPATASKPATSTTKPPATASKKPSGDPKTTSGSNTATAGTKPPTPANTPKNPDIPKMESEDVTKTNTEPVKPKPIQVTPPPPVLKERKNELFKTITTSERFVEISFFDNGEVDGDTISVFNNNRLVASRKGLSAKPVTIKIELSDADAQQDIIMVAENLGSIPPNTALMIVKAGDQRFTLNLSSTEQKNAMVRFKYQPE